MPAACHWQYRIYGTGLKMAAVRKKNANVWKQHNRYLRLHLQVNSQQLIYKEAWRDRLFEALATDRHCGKGAKS